MVPSPIFGTTLVGGFSRSAKIEANGDIHPKYVDMPEKKMGRHSNIHGQGGPHLQGTYPIELAPKQQV
jgi:hypothetical protein